MRRDDHPLLAFAEDGLEAVFNVFATALWVAVPALLVAALALMIFAPHAPAARLSVKIAGSALVLFPCACGLSAAGFRAARTNHPGIGLDGAGAFLLACGLFMGVVWNVVV
jgi:hypothetical protein